MKLGHPLTDICPNDTCKSTDTHTQTLSGTEKEDQRSVHQCARCNGLWTVHWVNSKPDHVHPGQEYIQPIAEGACAVVNGERPATVILRVLEASGCQCENIKHERGCTGTQETTQHTPYGPFKVCRHCATSNCMPANPDPALSQWPQQRRPSRNK